MTLTHNNLFLKLAGTLALFAAALVTFGLVNRGSRSTPGVQASSPAVLANAPTDTRIRNFQELVRSHPKDSRGYDFLGDAYLQKVRETGDASYYTRAGA